MPGIQTNLPNLKNPVLKNGNHFLTYGFEDKYYKEHKGNDFIAKKGQPLDFVVSPFDGIVSLVRANVTQNLPNNPTSLGNYVRIDFENGYQGRFGHLKYGSIVVNVGQKVKKGQIIGYMGNTGYAFGEHLHFDLMKDGKFIDGLPFLKGEKFFTEFERNFLLTYTRMFPTYEQAKQFVNVYSDYEGYSIVEKRVENVDKTLKVGDYVTVKANSHDVSGVRLSDFLQKTAEKRQIMTIKNGVATIGKNGQITARTKIENIVKVV